MPAFLVNPLVVFSLTLFTSATLLFLVQPMVGKMILPRLGGTPAVWNTCMVFFQAALLVGYAYAHMLSTRLPIRLQLLVHGLVILAPLAAFGFFPLGLYPGLEPPEASELPPVGFVLLLLAQLVGLPFLVVATSAPLLQKWFGHTGHPAAQDPYFLYAASNLGSMAALVLYPALVEPLLPLPIQGVSWMMGYGVLTILTWACGMLVLRSPGEAHGRQPVSLTPPAVSMTAPTVGRLLHWIVLAFVPSSLFIGATNYLTTDIAAIPLLWVIPLAIYLVSFILAFAGLPDGVRRCMRPILPMVVLLLVFLYISELTLPDVLGIPAVVGKFALHLLTLFVAATLCHDLLAQDRPAPRWLTSFYLCMSFGGVLGGLFNALLAPLIFIHVAEYHLVMALACMLLPSRAAPGKTRLSRWLDQGIAIALCLAACYCGWRGLMRLIQAAEANTLSAANLALPGIRPGFVSGGIILGLIFSLIAYVIYREEGRRQRLLDVGLVLALFVLAAGLMTRQAFADLNLAWLPPPPDGGGASEPSPNKLLLVVYGLPIALCFSFAEYPVRFGLGIVALLLAGAYQDPARPLLYQERSFFGVLKVDRKTEADGTYYRLWHGTTLHGQQKDGSPEPLTYYHRTGPAGQAFQALFTGEQAHVAIIGLGTGSLAWYVGKGQQVTFYEIDPAVVYVADQLGLFTYLEDCKRRGGSYRVELGDARLRLRYEPPGHFQMLVVDAFSSDAIPVHLITREAVALYFDKLTADGVLLLHISNRYLDLAPVLANIARDLGLVGLRQEDDAMSDAAGQPIPGKQSSVWVVLARQPEHLQPLKALGGRTGWHELSAKPDEPAWTDDYSNLLGILRWGGRQAN